MAWTTPMTAVENSLLTAAQFNVHVRNNLLETEAARATTGNTPGPGTGATARVWGTEGPNRSAEHYVKDHNIDTLETTSADETYVDLATPGPLVTVVTAYGFLIMVNCQLGTNTVNNAQASYEIYESDALGNPPDVEDGYFSSPANTGRAIEMDGAWPNGTAASSLNRYGVVQVWAAVPIKGLYTVKMKYKCTNNDAVASFAQRRLQVMAI